MYVYIYIYIYIYVYIYTYIYIHIYIYTHAEGEACPCVPSTPVPAHITRITVQIQIRECMIDVCTHVYTYRLQYYRYTSMIRKHKA